MKKIPVIIDCDPGHDDMMAIVLAVGSEKLDVKAITTVAGNKPLEMVTRNALNVLNYVGATEVKVAPGYVNPMVRKYRHANERVDEIRNAAKAAVTGGAHGATGLDGFDFTLENSMAAEKCHAVEMIARVLRESDEKVTLIAVGPFTNIGLFIRAYPDLLEKIEKISIMGGTCKFLFTRPFMEFNTFMDPEATKILFESGIPIDMYGYDVTYRVLFGDKDVERIAAINNKTSFMVSQLLAEFKRRHNGSFTWLDMGDFCPIHDACAVAGVIDPSLITEAQMMHVDVETKGEYLDGATICDWGDVLGLPHNVNVIFGMDNPRFLDYLAESVARLK